MRKLSTLFLCAIVMLTASIFCAAQSPPKTEVAFTGIFSRVNPNVRTPTFRFDKATDEKGAGVNLTRFIGDSPFGITFGAEATFKGGAQDSSLVTVGVGPTLKARGHRIEPFVTAKVGVARQAAANQQTQFNTISKSDTGFAWSGGGGIDVALSKRVELRLIQAEYLQTRIFNTSANYARLSAGFVFRL